MIKLINTVVFIILNENNQVLLLKKEESAEEKEKEQVPVLALNKKDQDNSSKEEWFMLVGNSGDDEDPRLVIKREVKKELDCEVINCSYFNLYFNPISENFIKKTVYFYGSIKGEPKLRQEMTTWGWIDLDEEQLNDLFLPAEQKEALIDFSNFLQNKFMEQID